MLAFALPALAAFTPYQQLKAARVQDVRSSALVSPLDGLAGGRSLVVVLPDDIDKAYKINLKVGDGVATGAYDAGSDEELD